MKKKVIAHFQRVDPILSSVIGTIGSIPPPTTSADYFFSLCREIISQQLSDKASATILARFQHLFPNRRITPDNVLRLKREQIRAAGPSWAKVDFLQNLARKVLDGELALRTLETLSDEAVVAELTKVKGIGRWTAEMFLMFSLGRDDVFSYEDLGLRKAMQKVYKFKREPTRKQIEKITKKWSPYRTWGCRVLWRSLDR